MSDVFAIHSLFNLGCCIQTPFHGNPVLYGLFAAIEEVRESLKTEATPNVPPKKDKKLV